jgi:DNA-binding transcriptional regulator YhcF (GntR family)
MEGEQMDRSTARAEPPYVRIVTAIRHRITSGELRAGDRVPSTRQISQEWGVAIATATKVLTTLRQDGLVRAVPGVGTVVASPEARPAPSPRTPRRRPARESEPELTRDRVVRTAIAIADAEGLAALSMRRVATELGIATMSLYRYVEGKEELVLLMADAVFGEAALPDPPPPGWRTRLELSARRQWEICRRHTWVARVISLTRPQLIPNGMAHTEWALRAVDGLGLDPATMLRVAITMAGYVLGTAVALESEVEAEQDTGLSSDEWMETQESSVAEILASGRFPTLSSLVTQPDLDVDLDNLFEFGLKLTLDGLATLLDGSQA